MVGDINRPLRRRQLINPVTFAVAITIAVGFVVFAMGHNPSPDLNDPGRLKSVSMPWQVLERLEMSG